MGVFELGDFDIVLIEVSFLFYFGEDGRPCVLVDGGVIGEEEDVAIFDQSKIHDLAFLELDSND